MAFEASRPRLSPHSDRSAAPVLAPGHLDALWFQVTGTLCNLRCAHCFLSCAPENETFGLLSIDEIRAQLEVSVSLGVREYYFTGGEPFLHPRIVEILALALSYGPTTVLTNGTLLRPRHLEPLAAASAASPWSLEFRLSLDGFDADSNDVLRGAGSFERAMDGLELLLRHGFLPILTVVRTWDPDAEPAIYERFVAELAARGCTRPRIKTMPALRIGCEAERTGGYRDYERVTNEMLDDYDLDQLVCAHSRVVTDRGIWVCPILLDAPDGDLGHDLRRAASAPFALAHGACHTCWMHGAICANPGGSAPEIGAPGAEVAVEATESVAPTGGLR
ncbi:MAG TPA: radical SAM protein [Gemmatimonadota bacterium]|nr:radical SAM protein [Gemmatimonadota bacterium]